MSDPDKSTAESLASEVATPEFLRLFTLHQPQTFAYIFSLLPNWHDAQEVLQETSVVMWRAFASFQPGTNFRAWAFQVAFHQVLSFRRRNKKLPLPMSDAFLDAVAHEEDALAEVLEEQLRVLRKCVDKLPPRDAELLRRCYLGDISTKLVAEQLGRPAATVYKMLARIRSALFACVQRTLALEQDA